MATSVGTSGDSFGAGKTPVFSVRAPVQVLNYVSNEMFVNTPESFYANYQLFITW